MSNADIGEYGLQVIREVLEGLMEPALASVVLLEALATLPNDQPLPSTTPGLLELVSGPIAKTLSERLGASQSAMIIDRIEGILGATFDLGLGAPTPVVVSRPSHVSTVDIATPEGPTRLLLVARSDRLRIRLEVAVGVYLVEASTATDVRAIVRKRRIDPHLIIVDGQDAPEISSVALAEELQSVRDDQVVIVWATDQPWGSAVSAALDRSRTAHVKCPRSEGVEPLVDYVRARID